MKLPKTLPFKDFYKLVNIMFNSNYGLTIFTDKGFFSNIVQVEEYDTRNKRTDVTITSIEVKLPQFSICDTVMIVDTGEIGTIESESRTDYDWLIELKSGTPFVANNYELVKIPTDLINLLQS